MEHPRHRSIRTRTLAGLALAGLALGACGPKPLAYAPAQTAVAAASDPQLSVEQLQAKAAAAEADAARLEAQAAAGTFTLGAGDETLHSGQYYKDLPLSMNAGDIYQVNYTAHGYTPVIVVLDQNKQPFTQSVAGPQLQPGQPLTTEIRPDKAGTWYVLLSALAPGAGGTFEVNIQKVTEKTLQ